MNNEGLDEKIISLIKTHGSMTRSDLVNKARLRTNNAFKRIDILIGEKKLIKVGKIISTPIDPVNSNVWGSGLKL